MTWGRDTSNELIELLNKPQNKKILNDELIENGNKYYNKKDTKSMVYSTLELIILTDTFNSIRLNEYIFFTIRAVEENENNRQFFEDLVKLSCYRLETVLDSSILIAAHKDTKRKIDFLSCIINTCYLKLGNKKGSKAINGYTFNNKNLSTLNIRTACKHILTTERFEELNYINL